MTKITMCFAALLLSSNVFAAPDAPFADPWSDLAQSWKDFSPLMLLVVAGGAIALGIYLRVLKYLEGVAGSNAEYAAFLRSPFAVAALFLPIANLAILLLAMGLALTSALGPREK